MEERDRVRGLIRSYMRNGVSLAMEAEETRTESTEMAQEFAWHAARELRRARGLAEHFASDGERRVINLTTGQLLLHIRETYGEE